MRGFFKIFFASFLALAVFSVIAFFIISGLIAALASGNKPRVEDKSVLVIDLSKTYLERAQSGIMAALSGEDNMPGLYEVVRLIEKAKTDERISGIYLDADGGANGFASSQALRRALLDFKSSKKFVIAHADAMSQGAYLVASAADRVYVNPAGSFDWRGYNMTSLFVKELLDRLGIEPQIFYAGKFKSATEIFRTTEMTPENRLQTEAWLGDLYRHFLSQASASRGIDTATLHRLAVTAAVRTPSDAVSLKLIDGVRYDDEVKTEIKQKLSIDKKDKLNFLPINKYNEASSLYRGGDSRVALIYAEGDIVDGNGTNTNIGGDRFRSIIRKARLDEDVRAIVLRVNSGGGSALASENIWRELQQAKADGKPVVVSFGDVAASGGYYIAAGADAIFAEPNTITGSIGVFGVLPNMQRFFNDKLGITFDGVKTAPFADAGAIYRPLSEQEKTLVQAGVDQTYALFKQRVAEGRRKPLDYVDSIAQGRVWSGEDALALGLVDRLGGMEAAIAEAARRAKLSDYGFKEYPEEGNWFEDLLGQTKPEPAAAIREAVGEDSYRILEQLTRIRRMTSGVQARMPFEFTIR